MSLRVCLVWGLLAATACLPAAAQSDGADPYAQARASITAADCLALASVLAAAEFDGRFTGTEGARRAGDYIARRFASLGLVPGGDGATYFQGFPLPRIEEFTGAIGSGNGLVMYRGAVDEHYRYGVDYAPLPGSPEGRYYGALEYLGPPKNGTPAAFEYTEELVGGKIVVVEATPKNPLTAGLVRLLAGRGCQGVVLLPGRAARQATQQLSGILPLPVVELAPLTTSRFLAGFLRALVVTATSGTQHDVHIEMTVARTGHKFGRGRNVIGILPGSGKRNDEVIIIGAHYDHLGRGTRRDISRGTEGVVHNGANDNASGIAAVLELAVALSALQPRLERTIVFLAFDAEEINRRGSRHYVQHPTTTMAKTVALLNMDMIGRNERNHIHACKLPAYEGLNRLTAIVAAEHGIALDTARMEMLVARSDIAPFAALDVPSVCFFSGEHPGYHSDTDDAEWLDGAKMERITRMLFDLTLRCANHTGTFRRPRSEDPK
ncbi:MAG: M20/M25/M40 family metallo-hydrolase [Planctomycetota bacterium]